MGIFCRETALASKLKSIGFNPVALPQEGLNPLLLLKVEGGSLTKVADLKQALQLHELAPERQRMIDFEGFKTSKVSAAASNRYLSGLMNGTFSGKLSGNLKQVENIRYVLSNVIMESFSRDFISDVVNESMHLLESDYIRRHLLSSELYLITDVLKSNKVMLTDGYTAKTDIRLPGDQNTEIAIEEGELDQQTFEAAVSITFAIKAYRLVFENERLVDFKKSDKTYRSGDDLLLANNYGSRYWNFT